MLGVCAEGEAGGWTGGWARCVCDALDLVRLVMSVPVKLRRASRARAALPPLQLQSNELADIRADCISGCRRARPSPEHQPSASPPHCQPPSRRSPLFHPAPWPSQGAAPGPAPAWPRHWLLLASPCPSPAPPAAPFTMSRSLALASPSLGYPVAGEPCCCTVSGSRARADIGSHRSSLGGSIYGQPIFPH